MKKLNKTSLISIFVLLILASIFFFTIGKNLIENNKINNVIIIDNNAIFKEQGNNKWKNISFNKITNYNWKKYNTYIDNSYYGKYYLYNNEKWYLFKDKTKAVNYDGNLLALGGNIKYKVVNFTTYDIEDYTYVKKVLNDNEISEKVFLTSDSLISIDINNDGIKESIYTISNKFSTENDSDIQFSFVFMVKNNKIIYLYKNIEKNQDNIYVGCKPYINSILDINEDNKYEIILSCSYYSNNGIEHKMYKYENQEFKMLVSN